MNLRIFRLRTVGPPLAVAAVCVAGLVWFDKVWIPAQQQYLNERNLRSLRTISAQIKAKVDNFDSAIDHAIDSFPIIEEGKKELLKKYVKLFSPELEIVTFESTHPAWTKVRPGDPPNVQIQRDDGRNYLYIGYLHEKTHRTDAQPVALIARGDVEQVVADASLGRTDFDALVLVDAHGATIAQQSSSGLELTSVDKLRDHGPSAAAGKETSVIDRMRGTTNLAVVTIGAADYMLYAQPVQLSLMHEAKDNTQAAEEWTLCGLVRLDRFRATSSTIPTTYWLLFGGVLALICFTIPVVKLWVLSPRERLRRVDSVSVTAATFMLMALAGFIALDFHVFGMIVPAALDAQLEAVSSSIATNVQLEAAAVAAQMKAFESQEVWQGKLQYQKEDQHQSLEQVREHLEPGAGADINLESNTSHRSKCKPSWSCRSGVLRDLGEIHYPFFSRMAWSDTSGWQRIKWSTASVVTPFININQSKFAYADSLKLARRLSGANVATSGVSVMLSPNTGEKVTSFWQALPPKTGKPGDDNKPDLLGATLTTAPLSLTNSVLPKNVQFAVLDRTGRVLFHHDTSRSLTENFFQESEESPQLKSLVASRDRGAVTGRYLGRAHRFYVTPLEVALFDPRWSLVVFQDAAVSETANLQTISLAVSLFMVYAVVLAALWAALVTIWPRAVTKWLWPDPAKGVQYRRAASAGTAIAAVWLIALGSLKPADLVCATAVLIVGGLAAMFKIIRSGARGPGESSARWLTDFFWTRASLLFLLGAVPAMVCFHVAFAFHTDLVARRAQSHLASELGARARRINQQMQRMAICSEDDAGTQACAGVKPIVARRTMDTLWDVHVPAIPDEPAARTDDTSLAARALRSFLMHSFRPYNDIAADLLMGSTFRPGRGLDRWRLALGPDKKKTFTSSDTSTGWKLTPSLALPSTMNAVSWLIAAVLWGVAYLLVRYVLRPLFGLDLNPPAPLLAASPATDDTSLLVVGPPGSRRTERLRQHPRVRIFDVRSLTFTDEPTLMMPSSSALVSSAADCGHAADARDLDWTESIQLATSDPLTFVAVDHLERCLDDQAFRGRMLECLESAVYRHGATIWCGSVRDPIEILEELDPPAPDRHRWMRLLEAFRRERLGIAIDQARTSALRQSLQERRDRLTPALQSLIVAECKAAPELLAIGEDLAVRLPPDVRLSDEAVLAAIGLAAAPFYTALWSNCSTDERVALRQLAEEGLMNPNNPAAISRLLSTGLVYRDPTFHVMNETFRRFVIGAASQQLISTWEHQGVRVPWATIATTGVTVAFGLAGLLLLTQEQLVDAWISYVPAVAPAIPAVWKALATVQKGKIEANG